MQGFHSDRLQINQTEKTQEMKEQKDKFRKNQKRKVENIPIEEKINIDESR